jgi:hypothetical protein
VIKIKGDEMKKRILVVAVASIGLATVLMAHGGDGDNDEMMGQGMQQGKMGSQMMMQRGQMGPQAMQRGGQMGPKYMMNKGQRGVMGMRGSMMQNPMQMMKNMRKMHTKMMMNMLSKLNLSDTQKKQIQQLQKKNMMNMDKILEAFGKDSFDKDKFIKIMKSKRENMIKSRANMLEGIFKILDKKQREDFVTLIKAKHIMMR